MFFNDFKLFYLFRDRLVGYGNGITCMTCMTCINAKLTAIQCKIVNISLFFLDFFFFNLLVYCFSSVSQNGIRVMCRPLSLHAKARLIPIQFRVERGKLDWFYFIPCAVTFVYYKK